MNTELRLAEIELEIEVLENKVSEKEHTWDNSKSWEEYCAYMSPEWKALNKLDREKRMIMPYKLSVLPDYGDVMSLVHFIECVDDGGFIDYDGHGRYVKDGQETDILIYPSDVEHKSIRKEFDTIIWFNR
jgi:hypothetical protein